MDKRSSLLASVMKKRQSFTRLRAVLSPSLKRESMKQVQKTKKKL